MSKQTNIDGAVSPGIQPQLDSVPKDMNAQAVGAAPSASTTGAAVPAATNGQQCAPGQICPDGAKGGHD